MQNQISQQLCRFLCAMYRMFGTGKRQNVVRLWVIKHSFLGSLWDFVEEDEFVLFRPGGRRGTPEGFEAVLLCFRLLQA